MKFFLENNHLLLIFIVMLLIGCCNNEKQLTIMIDTIECYYYADNNNLFIEKTPVRVYLAGIMYNNFDTIVKFKLPTILDSIDNNVGLVFVSNEQNLNVFSGFRNSPFASCLTC